MAVAPRRVGPASSRDRRVRSVVGAGVDSGGFGSGHCWFCICECYHRLPERATGLKCELLEWVARFSSSRSGQKPANLAFELGPIFDLAFPNRQDFPTKLLPRFQVIGVALAITLQLGTPVFDARLRYVRVDAAGMLVPEASSYLDNAF